MSFQLWTDFSIVSETNKLDELFNASNIPKSALALALSASLDYDFIGLTDIPNSNNLAMNMSMEVLV